MFHSSLASIYTQLTKLTTKRNYKIFTKEYEKPNVEQSNKKSLTCQTNKRGIKVNLRYWHFSFFSGTHFFYFHKMWYCTLKALVGVWEKTECQSHLPKNNIDSVYIYIYLFISW